MQKKLIAAAKIAVTLGLVWVIWVWVWFCCFLCFLNWIH